LLHSLLAVLKCDERSNPPLILLGAAILRLGRCFQPQQAQPFLIPHSEQGVAGNTPGTVTRVSSERLPEDLSRLSPTALTG
jgi:hypothetical protein